MDATRKIQAAVAMVDIIVTHAGAALAAAMIAAAFAAAVFLYIKRR